MIEELKKNFTALVSRYEEQKLRADELDARLAESGEELRSRDEKIKELNRQIDNLKLSSAFTDGAGSAAAKERIEKLIHEIDKCIALLEA